MSRVNVGRLPASNPNLLDNWYFAAPINQKGQNKYDFVAANVVGIDRWYSHGPWRVMTVEDDCVTLGPTTSRENVINEFYQPMEWNPDGMTLTFSILTANGNLFSCTARDIIFGYNKQYANSTVNDGEGHTGYISIRTPQSGHLLRCYIVAWADNSLSVVAAKLELGEHQTLAAQTDDGIWQLIDPAPNPTAELEKCRRYQQVIGGEAYTVMNASEVRMYEAGTQKWTVYIPVQFFPPMRGKPTLAVLSTRGDTSIAALRYGPSLTTVKSDDEQYMLTVNNYAAAEQISTCGDLRLYFTQNDTAGKAGTLNSVFPWIYPNVKLLFDANI